ncbi:MAG: hypothetical protein AB7S70_08550 [Hyphomicrobium sp.]|uniref:hypothetical protein n=1 Tax=Hyphomicrobium sp. TaxID=82 RepID=UPI003D10842B
MIGLALFALIGIGIRLLMMFTIQQSRERMNRQINERLRTLIAAYKILGGSFTGKLTVDPTHLRDLRRPAEPIAESDADAAPASAADDAPSAGGTPVGAMGSDRARRIRDEVEAVLSDIILLGTEDQVRLAERAARELVAGRPVHTHELVVSLRNFIRDALDLDPIPADLEIPMQGPRRPPSAGGMRGRSERGSEGGRQGGGGRGGGGGMGAGMAMGGGMGAGLALGGGENPPTSEHGN